MEPDFQELDEKYEQTESPLTNSFFGQLVQWFDSNSGNNLKLKLPQEIIQYKQCKKCGALTPKFEFKCETCASESFEEF